MSDWYFPAQLVTIFLTNNIRLPTIYLIPVLKNRHSGHWQWQDYTAPEHLLSR